jgi:hypothetical protein
LGSFLKITEEGQIIGIIFPTAHARNEFIFSKHGLGYIEGDFFRNASGHPAPDDLWVTLIFPGKLVLA